MEISALRLQYSEQALEWYLSFFMDPEIVSAMPDENHNLRSVYDAGKALEYGTVIAYVPIVDGDPAGLFWGSFFGCNTIEGHWGILRRYRKRGVAQACCDAVFARLAEDFPQVTNVIGQVAKCNLKSYAGAIRSGFSVVGTLPRSHRKGGKLYDSWILRREVG